MRATFWRRGTALLMTGPLLLGAAVATAVPAAASCLASPGDPAQYDSAEVVVEGVFADGATDSSGVLVRPAAFDVARYAKGSGPERIDVEAGGRQTEHGIAYTSIDVLPPPGEAWRLYGRFDEEGELDTDSCSGSRPMVTAYADACPGDVPEDGFRDVAADDLHEPAVDCSTWRGITQGTAAATYAPDAVTTRAQLASLVVRALQDTQGTLPEQPADAFDDDEGSVHEHAIDQLAALGVLAGTGPRRFWPDAPVSRGQAVAVLVRAQERDSGELLPVTRDHFVDDEGNVHELAIDKAADARYAGGTTSSTFSPDAPVARRQTASLLVRWIDLRVGPSSQAS